MQSIQVIETIEWVQAIFSERAKAALFSYALFQRNPSAKENDPTIVGEYIHISHELTRAVDAIVENPNAVQVLKAFGLGDLTDRNLGTKLALAAASDPLKTIPDLIEPLVTGWRVFTSWVDPLRSLIMPGELLSSEVPESIVSLVLLYRENESPSLEKLSNALRSLDSVYLSIARIYGLEDSAGHLQLVKIESGSAVRVDSKGLGAAVKHLKEFVIEAWHKFRHKQTEEVIEKNRAILSTVAAVQHIELSVQNGDMSREQGELLKRSTLQDTLGLFEAGALITEIPPEEIIDNTKLLRDFGTKLLMAPKNDEVSSDGTAVGERQQTVPVTLEEVLPATKPTSSKRAGKKRGAKKAHKSSQKKK